jgi:hypothetical protein
MVVAAMSLTYMVGFETGDLGELLQVASCSCQTSVVRSGAYALKITGAAGGAYALLPSVFTYYVRFGLYFTESSGTGAPLLYHCTSTTPASGSPPTGGASATHCYILLTKISGSYYLQLWDGGGQIGSNHQVSASTWYLIEVRVIPATGGGNNGIVDLKVNGSSVASSTTRNTFDESYREYVEFTLTGNTGWSVYLDDIAMSDTGWIGDGHIIARQGKSGTPTYDGFTKTGAATADACWSETPYSATKYAASTGTPQTQSMLTASFSSTQTGHGSEVIASGDTINGCLVRLVGKVSAGASKTYQVLYRSNGSDTLRSIALITTDGATGGSIFTDTLSNINASELGAKRSGTAGGAELQVEDMWLMIDYLAAAGGLSIPVASNSYAQRRLP